MPAPSRTAAAPLVARVRPSRHPGKPPHSMVTHHNPRGAVGVTEVTTARRREMLLLWRDDSVPPDHADAPPGEGLGQGRQARCSSPAPRRMVPGGPYLLEPHRRARREPAQRAGRPALPRDPLSPAGAVEHRAVRAALYPAGGPPLPAHVCGVPELPPPAGVRGGLERADVRTVQEDGGIGVG